MKHCCYKEKYENLKKELEELKKIIELVQSRELYYLDVDYDWEENPINITVPFDLESEVDTYLGIDMEKSKQKKIIPW